MDLDKNTLGGALYIPIVSFRFGKSSSLITLRASHLNGDGDSVMEVVPEINFGLIERVKATKVRKWTVKVDERKSKCDSVHTYSTVHFQSKVLPFSEPITSLT